MIFKNENNLKSEYFFILFLWYHYLMVIPMQSGTKPLYPGLVLFSLCVFKILLRNKSYILLLTDPQTQCKNKILQWGAVHWPSTNIKSIFSSYLEHQELRKPTLLSLFAMWYQLRHVPMVQIPRTLELKPHLHNDDDL